MNCLKVIISQLSCEETEKAVGINGRPSGTRKQEGTCREVIFSYTLVVLKELVYF